MEKRRHHRYPVRQSRRNSPLYADSPYKVLDVSMGGCLIETATGLWLCQQPCRLELPLPLQAGRLSLTAAWVWSRARSDHPGEEYGLYGFRFLEMDDMNLRILEAYLDFLSRDLAISEVEKTWAELRDRQEKFAVLAAYQERQQLRLLH